MKQLVGVNLTTKAAKNWTPAEYTFGEDLTLALRFYKNSEGQEIEATMTVNSIKADIGLVDARPAGGKFAIKIGAGAISESNTTDLLDNNILASDLKTKLNAVEALGAYGTAQVIFTDGSWLMFFGDQSQQVPLEAVHNGLWPVSLVRFNAWKVDGKWVHEMRLIQAPVALTTSHDIVLPPEPTITRTQAGGSDAGFTWNEEQELYIPREFRGAFVIKRGFARTSQLSRDETIDTIQAALQALGENCFKVTLPLSQRPTIEFVGDYAGTPQDLLVTQVTQAPAGDLSFTIKLDRAELGVMLRRGAVTLPLQITIVGTDDGGVTGKQVAFMLDVTIKPPVSWPEIEENPTMDLIRPYSAKTYMPFGANNTLMGQEVYPEVVGDGEQEVFVIAHGLNSEVAFVWGRENISGGRQLVQGTDPDVADFSVTIDSDNQVTVTALNGPPALDAWALIIFSGKTVQRWAADLTVTVLQVIAGGGYPSLPAFMDNTLERLEDLEDLIVPGTVPAVANAPVVGMETLIPEIKEVLNFKGDAAAMAAVFGEMGVDPTKLDPRRAPYLLPAVHNGTLTDPLPDPLPAPAAGTVWVAGARTLIPSVGGVRGGYVENDGYVASDGRGLWVAERSGTTNSYFAKAFNRTLWPVIINDDMLAVGRTLEALWGVQTQLIHANCEAQWVMAVELATIDAETAPSPLEVNLEELDWGDPVFTRPIGISSLAQSHFFGIRIKRTGIAEFILDQNKYGNFLPNNAAAPATANFALRARLVDLDTENVPDPRGYLAWKLIGSIEIAADGKQTTKPAKVRIY